MSAEPQIPSESKAQRGKRKSALRFEILAGLLVVAAVFDFKATSGIFTLAFPACLAYAGALRGIDQHYNTQERKVYYDSSLRLSSEALDQETFHYADGEDGSRARPTRRDWA